MENKPTFFKVLSKKANALQNTAEKEKMMAQLSLKLAETSEESKLSKRQIEEYLDMFKLYDKDDSGSISVNELGRVLENAGMEVSRHHLQAVMTELDIDCSGSIEFAEFLAVMSRLLEDEDSEEDLVTIFRILDQDGDGFITKGDLKECCTRVGSHLTPQDLDEMVTEADKDGDGQITYEEFIKILQARS